VVLGGLVAYIGLQAADKRVMWCVRWVFCANVWVWVVVCAALDRECCLVVCEFGIMGIRAAIESGCGEFCGV